MDTEGITLHGSFVCEALEGKSGEAQDLSSFPRQISLCFTAQEANLPSDSASPQELKGSHEKCCRLVFPLDIIFYFLIFFSLDCVLFLLVVVFFFLIFIYFGCIGLSS